MRKVEDHVRSKHDVPVVTGTLRNYIRDRMVRQV